MKKNYSAWEIPYDDFFKLAFQIERLRFLVQFAILAPSTHNSQPWKFEVGEDSILLKTNFERALAVSDPTNRHLYISLGCALANLLVAADYYGFQTSLEYFPSDRPDVIIKVHFNPSSRPASIQNHLIFAIPRRRSNRSRYTNRMPVPEFLTLITTLSSQNLGLSVVADEQKKNKIAEILMESRIKAFSVKAFRNEMANYKRTNFTSSSIGMPGFVMGFSNIFSLMSPVLMRHFNVMKMLRKSEGV